MLRKRRSQGQRRQGQLFFNVFFSFFFFRQGHFPTQVFTCQEEIQTSYGHRCGHIWSQYGVLRFMGIELRMWYYDTLDCTNIYICYPIGVLGQEKSDAGQPDPPNQPEAKYPSGVAGFSLVCFTHTYIYMYSTGVWAEISTVNLHTFNAIAFYCSHSHRPQCRYITGPQDIYIYSEIHALHLLY